MRPGARTPEELETLLEDALLLCDHSALARLFEDSAVLAVGASRHEARGRAEIARFMTAIAPADRAFIAAPLRVLQARQTALVAGERAINVVRRGHDGNWRYAISLLSPDPATTKE